MKSIVSVLVLLTVSAAAVNALPNASREPVASVKADSGKMNVVPRSLHDTAGRANMKAFDECAIPPAAHNPPPALYAQAPEPPGGRGPGEGPPERGGRSSYKSKLIFVTHIIDELQLDDDVAAEFLEIFLKYGNIREKLDTEQMDLIQQISEDANDDDVSTDDLKKKLAMVEKVQKEQEKQNKAFLARAEKILSERQYIKLVVFEDRLKYDLMRRFRMNRRGGSKEWSEEDRKRIDKHRQEMKQKVEDAEKKYKTIIEKSMDDDQ